MATLKFDRALVKAMLDTVLSDSAEVHLVKDDGIYLMSFGDKPTNAGPDWKRVVAYARGFDPKKDGEDVWDKCRAAVGGDDFGEKVGTKKEYLEMLNDSVGDIMLKVTANSICSSYTPKVANAPHPYKPFDMFKGNKTKKWRVVHSRREDGTPLLYAPMFQKKSDAVQFVKALKADATFKAMQDGIVARTHKAGV